VSFVTLSFQQEAAMLNSTQNKHEAVYYPFYTQSYKIAESTCT